MTLEITSMFENSTPKLQYCFCSWQNDKHGITAGFPGFTTRDGDALEMLTSYGKKYGNNNFTSLMGKIKNALNTDNNIQGYCQAWKKVSVGQTARVVLFDAIMSMDTHHVILTLVRNVNWTDLRRQRWIT